MSLSWEESEYVFCELQDAARHIRKHQSEGFVHAVDDFSFTIAPGETVGLVGERGCRFHPRCPKVQPDCSREAPVLIEVETGRWVRCPFYKSEIRNPKSEIGL